MIRKAKRFDSYYSCLLKWHNTNEGVYLLEYTSRKERLCENENRSDWKYTWEWVT